MQIFLFSCSESFLCIGYQFTSTKACKIINTNEGSNDTLLSEERNVLCSKGNFDTQTLLSSLIQHALHHSFLDMYQWLKTFNDPFRKGVIIPVENTGHLGQVLLFSTGRMTPATKFDTHLMHLLTYT